MEVIAAISFQESQTKQYAAADGAVGFLVHNLTECRHAFQNGSIDDGGLVPPPGPGLMQLTSITATDPSIPNHDPVNDITDWRYNLEAGVQVLSQKYAIAAEMAPSCVREILQNPESRKVVENWFYAIKFYNGAPTSDQYRDLIYGHIANPPDRIKGLFPPVQVTRPEAAIAGFGNGQSFVADKNGTWTAASCAAYAKGAGSVHSSTSFATPYAHQFGNISTRLNVGQHDRVLIGGFIITGSQSKKLIVRAVGPSVAIDNTHCRPAVTQPRSAERTTGRASRWWKSTR